VGTVVVMTRRLAGRYVLGEQLGAGGTARVHAAVDERLGRRVAVKLLDARIVAAADPAGRERFLREGQTTAGFNHRYAVTVFDAGEDDGDLFIVMELVDGPSLAEHLARTGPLPVDETLRLAGQVLSVLAAAHAADIVHRDVKPANILIGADGETRLADFGIAKRFDELDASVTSVGMVIGTPRYLAPEQALGSPATPASDVYAMGVVMFEMLTGRLPFEGDQPTAAALASRTAPDVRAVRPDVPAALASAIASALATEPGDRPATAAELLALLDGTWQATAGSSTADATRLMVSATASAGADATEVLPVVPMDSPARSSGRTAVAVFAVLLVVLGGVIAAATLGTDDSGTSAVDAVVTADAAAAATTLAPPPATDPPVTDPPVTEPPVTEPPVTEPAVTEPPVTEPPVIEVIPGFPATDDIEVFLAQVERDPELVGSAGEALADDLRNVLERRGVNQRKAAEDLREMLVVWTDAGAIQPAIAVALDDLLAPLV
jgi:tRNA A-37 threonylcarbamoyl transferase component Bud32